MTDLTYISLGGGVQSSALLALSALGMHGVPRADVAIFADTQAEIAATYSWLDRLAAWSSPRGMPIIRCTRGSLEESALASGVNNMHGRLPTYTRETVSEPCPCKTTAPALPFMACGACGGSGIVESVETGLTSRHCTWNFKIEVVHRAAREQMGLVRGQRAKGVVSAVQMLGISTDEAHRMKPSRIEWITHSYPLIDAGLSRDDCKRICREVFGEVPPRSSCYFCPYHSDAYWRWLRDSHPPEYAKAVDFDARFRLSQPRLRGEVYIHRSMRPLDEAVSASSAPERGDAFGGECEGVCGV